MAPSRLPVLWSVFLLSALSSSFVLAVETPQQARLALSAPAYERTDSVRGELRLPEVIDVKGATVTFEVSDSFSRVLLRKTEALSGEEASTSSIKIDLKVPNVVVMRHYLGATVRDGKGNLYFGQSSFVFKPPAGWSDYDVTIYQKHPANRLGFIRDAYVTTNLWYGSNPGIPDYMIDANFRWYVDNTCVPVLAPYHRWYPDGRPVDWLFRKARERFRADRSLLNLQRTPCLSQEPTRELLERAAQFVASNQAAYRPVWYSLGDETGMGNQAAASGYCFSPECRIRFREWLKERYRDLDALNAEWGTKFAKWEDVLGSTPDEIFARTDDNFASWCDHTDFADDVLMDAYALGAKKIREYDPGAYVGIGGGQGPVAVGGWDYWKLSQTLNAMEPYYIADNYELLRSFNPDFRYVSISGGGQDKDRQHRWYGFVHGDSGSLMWDDKNTFVDDQGKYDTQGTESAKWHKELTSGLARQYMSARRTDDPIAVYESQASLRVHWVLNVRPKGKDWANRDSWHERTDNPYSRVRSTWLKLIEDAGLQYKMLAPQQVLEGRLKNYDPKTGDGFKLLILPRTIALSAGEAEAIRKFAEAGGTVIADGLVGLFDEHGKRLPAGQLDDFFGVSRPADQEISMFGKMPSGLEGFNLLEAQVERAAGAPAQPAAPKALITCRHGKGTTLYMNLDIIDYHRWRLHPGEEAATRKMMNPYFEKALGTDRRSPVFTVDGDVPAGVEIVTKAVGQARIVAMMRNPQMMVSELGPMEYQSNEGFAKPIDVELNPNVSGQDESFVYYDMRTGAKLGQGKSIKVTVPAFDPLVVSIWPSDPGQFAFASPAKIRRGDPLPVAVRPASDQADLYVYGVEVTGPDGKQRMLYRKNYSFGPQGGQIDIPLALNDQAGTWTIAVREALTGTVKNIKVQVE